MDHTHSPTSPALSKSLCVWQMVVGMSLNRGGGGPGGG